MPGNGEAGAGAGKFLSLESQIFKTEKWPIFEGDLDVEKDPWEEKSEVIGD